MHRIHMALADRHAELSQMALKNRRPAVAIVHTDAALYHFRRALALQKQVDHLEAGSQDNHQPRSA